MKGGNLQKSGFVWVPQLIVIGNTVVFIVAHMVKNPTGHRPTSWLFARVFERSGFPFGWGPIDHNSSFEVLNHAVFANYVVIILNCMMLKFLLRI